MTNIKYKEIEVPQNLKKKVILSIQKMSNRQLLIKKILGGLFLTVSSFSLLEFSFYLVSEFEKSGFFNYASLIISDSEVVFYNFTSFTLSLIDSTPFFAISLVVLSIFAIMKSLSYLATVTSKNSFISKQLLII
jgi:hypothetical protein